MPRVICTLDNASTLINGVAFTGEPGHMVSEDVADDIAAAFASIPGYRIAEPTGQTPPPAGGTDGTGQEGGAGGEGGGDPTGQTPPPAGGTDGTGQEGGAGGDGGGDPTKGPQQAADASKAEGKKKREHQPPAS